jgi:hypothetical protein
VNGDGYDDLIVGSGGKTVSYVVYGKTGGAAVNLSDIVSGDVTKGFMLMTPSSGYTIVSDAGDVNGDGFDDVIVGAPGDGITDVRQGVSYVVYGGNFTGAVTHLGTTGNDILSGTAANDVILGGRGDDVITGNGGIDRIVGGTGNDMLIISNANFGRVDGGAGTDTLRMAGTNGFTLNLSTLAAGAIKDIERIDLVAGSLNNILTVTQQTLMTLSTTTNRLMVLGGSGDTVNANGFNQFDSQTENGITYILYGNGSAELWVQSGVAVVTTAPLSSGFFSTGFDGNDMLIVGDANFLGVDGGAGTDTLRMAGTSGFTLDLPTLAPGAIKDIEVIDLVAGELNNILTVTQQTLLDLSTTSDLLTVLGDSGDTVNANGFSAGGAAQTVDGITYNVYNNGSAELWVQQGVVVDGIVPPPAGFVAPAISWTDQAVLGI